MRILIHGGTKDTVRVRFGEWPNLKPEWLNDPYAISLTLPSFGLVFPDGRPVLLYREWVNPERRGGIHFTVLIDPEDDSLWERAGWNAAGLLHCIFGEKGPRRDAFLAAESLTPEYVRTIFDKILDKNELSQIQPTIAQGDKNLALIWMNLLVGSLLSTSLTHANLNALGLSSRPLMQDVACWTAGINQFARGARGWLIGGTVFQANGLGAGLLLDDGPFGQKADASATIQAGRVAIEALDAMYKRPEHREGVQRFNGFPPWPSKRIVEFILEADHVGSVLVGNEDTFRCLLEGRETPSPKILEAAYANAMEKTDNRIPIGPFQTKVLLQCRHDLKCLLPPAGVQNLDRKVLWEQMDSENVPPEVPRNLTLPPDLSLDLCKLRVRKSKDRYGTTERCQQFLSSVGAEHLKSELWDFYNDWAFSEGTARLGGNSEIDRSSQVRALERLRAGRRDNEWLAEALSLLPIDTVTTELDRLSSDLQEPIDDLISIIPARGHQKAKKWLDDLAATQLRNKLSIETKIAILGATDPSSWRDLRVLRSALQGAGSPEPLIEVRNTDRNGEYLELLEWTCLRGKLGAAPPMFVSIAKILGFWPQYDASLRDLANRCELFRPHYNALAAAYAPPPAPAASPKDVPSVSDGTAPRKSPATQRQSPREAPAGNPLDEICELARRIDNFPRMCIDSDRKLLENINLCGNDQDYDTLFDLLWIVLKPPAEKQRKHEEFCSGIKMPLNWRLIVSGGSLMAFWGIAAALRTRWKLLTTWMDQAWQTSSDWMNILSVALLVIALGMIFAGVRRVRYCLLIDKERRRRAQVAIGLLLQSDTRTQELLQDLKDGKAGEVLKGKSRYLRALALFLAAEPEGSSHLPTDPGQRKKLRAELMRFLVKETLILKEGW